MLDVRDLRADPERARASQRSRGDDPQLIDALLSADDARRAALTDFEQARAEQRTFGRAVATAKGDERVALLARSKDLAARVKELQAAAAAHASALPLLRSLKLNNAVGRAPFRGYSYLSDLFGVPTR